MQLTECNGRWPSAHSLLLKRAAVNTNKRRDLVNHLAGLLQVRDGSHK